MSRQSFAASAAAVLFCTIAAVCFKSCHTEPLEFKNIAECKISMESRGFHCCIVHPEKASPVMVISQSPLTPEAAEKLSVHFSREDKTGKLIVLQGMRVSPGIHKSGSEYTCQWGDVAVMGDPEFMLKIEATAAR